MTRPAIRLRVERLGEGALQLVGAEHHYLVRVRRAHVGEVVELFDGEGGVAAATVVSIDADGAALEVGAVSRRERRGATLRAIVPLLKGERMDLCIEKLVEVGCDAIALWQAERSVVRLDGDKHAARVSRVAAQVAAATRQCGRAVVPAVEGIWTLREVIARATEPTRVALAPSTRPLAFEGPSGAAALISGPEGGFADAEIELLVAAGFTLASVADAVLRAETAPVIAVALWRWSELSRSG